MPVFHPKNQSKWQFPLISPPTNCSEFPNAAALSPKRCMFDHMPRMFENIDRMFDHIARMSDHIDRMFKDIRCMFENMDRMFENMDRMFDQLACLGHQAAFGAFHSAFLSDKQQGHIDLRKAMVPAFH
jgi:hypothetical protein